MKTFLVIVLVAVVGTVTSRHVPEDRDDDDAVYPWRPERPDFRNPVFYEREDDVGDDDALDGDEGYPLEDVIRRMQQRMSALTEMFRRMLAWRGVQRPVFDVDRYPPNYDNSTYETKVINGTVVSINETIKKHDGNDSNFFFHWKVIQIRPQNETAASSPDAEPAGPITREEGEVELGLPENDASTSTDANGGNDESNNIPHVVKR